MTAQMQTTRARRWSLLGVVGCLLLGSACSLFAPRSPRTGEVSVKPGINKGFLAKDLDVEKYVDMFEGESREIYTERHKITDTLGIQPGSTVADIGAGTGFLSVLFAKQAGSSGHVYAVDINPKFLERIDELASEKGLNQIKTVLCTEDSVELPSNSIDLAFICDTYHHFEYPMSTMATLHAAMKPGGELVVVDFIRIPGTSREWILRHVRAGQDVVIEEIEASGFQLIDRGEGIDYLTDNYLMRFRKVD